MSGDPQEPHDDAAALSATPLPLVVVVSGTPYELECDPAVSMEDVARMGLWKDHQHREVPNLRGGWELRDGHGYILDFDRALHDFGFQPGRTLFLSRRVGIGA